MLQIKLLLGCQPRKLLIPLKVWAILPSVLVQIKNSFKAKNPHSNIQNMDFANESQTLTLQILPEDITWAQNRRQKRFPPFAISPFQNQHQPSVIANTFDLWRDTDHVPNGHPSHKKVTELLYPRHLLVYTGDMKRLSYSDLVTKLKIKETKVRYWKGLLVKAELIDPKKGLGNKALFSEDDLEQFLKLQEFMGDGVTAAPQAIRMMQDKITPDAAIEKYQQAQRQIEVLQRKVLQLRKPFWDRITGWFKGVWKAVLYRQQV